jgi:hypothetical protein
MGCIDGFRLFSRGFDRCNGEISHWDSMINKINKIKQYVPQSSSLGERFTSRASAGIQ